MIVAAATVVVGLVLCAMAAFALAKLRLPCSGDLFALVVVSFLIPFDAIVDSAGDTVPRFRLAEHAMPGLILPGLGNGFAVFLLRQFFLGIPRRAVRGGAHRRAGLVRASSRASICRCRSPALIGAGLILFVFQWQSFLWPLLIAPDPDYKVAAVAIADFAGQFSTDYGMMFTAAIFVSRGAVGGAGGVPALFYRFGGIDRPERLGPFRLLADATGAARVAARGGGRIVVSAAPRAPGEPPVARMNSGLRAGATRGGRKRKLASRSSRAQQGQAWQFPPQ